MSLFITNKERGKKEGESDAAFWQDLLNEKPEPFTEEELERWSVPKTDKQVPKK